MGQIVKNITQIDETKLPKEGQAPSTFRANASYVWGRLKDICLDLNVFKDEVNSVANEINTNTQTVVTKAQEVSNNTTTTLNAKDEAIEAKEAIESNVAVLPAGSINDNLIDPLKAWSSTKVDNTKANKADVYTKAESKLITGTHIINVPADFPDIQSAVNHIRAFSIRGDIVIQLADGIYTWNTQLISYLTATASRLFIKGNSANNTAVVLKNTTGKVYPAVLLEIAAVNIEVVIENITFDGLNDTCRAIQVTNTPNLTTDNCRFIDNGDAIIATNSRVYVVPNTVFNNNKVSLWTTHGAYIIAPNVTIVGKGRSIGKAVYATEESFIYVGGGATISNTGDALNSYSGQIVAHDATLNNNRRTAIVDGGGKIIGARLKIDGTDYGLISSSTGGFIMTYDSIFKNVTDGCIWAEGTGGRIFAHRCTAIENIGKFIFNYAGSIDVGGSTVTTSGTSISCYMNGEVNAFNSKINSGMYGIAAGDRGFVNIVGSEATVNGTAYDLYVHDGGYIEALNVSVDKTNIPPNTNGGYHDSYIRTA